MSAPKRWIDDPAADAELRDTLRGAGPARQLDDVTRRRLSAKVARASALPAVAAGWLFVKSAAAALGVVVGTASIATYTGILKLPPAPTTAAPSVKPRVALRLPPAPVATPVVTPSAQPEPQLNPSPASPAVAAGVASGSSLASESLLLEQARREMRSAPATALTIADEHAQRFPRGQLGSERSLIQIEALHRLGRDREARALAGRMLAGGSTGLYAERIRQLLGPDASP
jgi:hypothetical protein